MGGYGSTRWGMERTRQETDALMRLEIGSLKRLGALDPDRITSLTWTRDGRPYAAITAQTNADASVLTLVYQMTNLATGTTEEVHDAILLERTPNTFGGSRVWFRCPGCHTRRAVLYFHVGRFRCRRCHHLAYTSTRETPYQRVQRRCRKLQIRLGRTSTSGVLWDDMPPKPKGMHWTTYHLLSLSFGQAARSGNVLFAEDLRTHQKRIEKLASDLLS